MKKKEKKVKDRGTRFPGAKGNVEAKPNGHIEETSKDQASQRPSTEGTMESDIETKPDGHVEGTSKDQVNLGTGAEEAMKNLDVKSETACV